MSYRPRWDAGNWKAVCDSCGRVYKASELRKRWDGLMVCNADWEPRQPQDFVRGVADIQAPPFSRVEGSDNFVPINYTFTFKDPLPLSDVFKRSVLGKDTAPITDSTVVSVSYVRNFSDSANLADSVVLQKVVGNPINAHAINSVALG